MTAAQRATLDHLRASHAQLDLDAMGFRQPQQYRLTLWTQYRRWLLIALKGGTVGVVFAGGMLCGLWLAVFQMVAR
jgi:hypothetical protein